MVEIKIHATGSKGNAYSIIDGNHRILIDPGIRFKRLQKKVGYRLSSYDFVLISHEHKDHCVAVPGIAKMGIPIATSLGTAAAIGHENFGTPPYTLQSEVPWLFKQWQVLPFETYHDAIEPLGFLIQTPSRKKICFATDTSHIRHMFKGVNIWMVEANYSEELLILNSIITESVKGRIRTSHFELGNAVIFFKNQDLSKTEKIYLIHLSENNSDEKRFKSEIEALTGKPVFTK